MKFLFIALFVLVATTIASAQEKKVVCYHGTWAVYRHGNGKFEVPQIDPFLCTHLIYSFFGIQENGELRVIDPYLDLEENWGKGNIKKFNALKQINPKLKTIAAVGGWNEQSYNFSMVAKDPVKRQRFIKSSIEFIKHHGFDGLDLDWEYPAQRDGDPMVDKKNHAIFVKELKQELSKYNLLLTAAVASAEFSSSLSYDIPTISKYLDFINVMAYDLHGAWDKTIGINAPLYAGETDKTSREKQLNTNASIHYWLSQGAPAEKIILGLPLYGRTFTLQSASQTKVGSPNVGPGRVGKYTNEPGMIGYNEFCEELKAEPWTIEWEGDQMVPYAHKGNQWIGFDDVKSIEHKAKFAKDLNLGGLMVWSIETDDFRGICGPKYPLLRKINDLLGREVPDPAPEPPTPKPEQPPIDPPMPPHNTECSPDGTFRHSNDCAAFYTCTSGRRHDFKCPQGLKFNEKLLVCDYPEKVECP